MKKILSLLILIAIFCMLMFQTTFAKNSTKSLLQGKTANKTFSLISDRLKINAPREIEDIAVNHNGIMGTTGSDLDETRLFLSDSEEKQKLVIYAYELYKISTGNITNDANIFIKNLDSKTTYTISKSNKVSNAEFITITPKNIIEKTSTFLKGALIKTSDESLVYVGVYVTPETLKYNKNCSSLADSILNSIQGGSRVLEKNKRTFKFYRKSIEVPDGYVSIKQSGVDFTVFTFRKVVPIGQDASRMLIAEDFSPYEFNINNKKYSKMNDKILGKKVTWYYYSDKKNVFDSSTFYGTSVPIGNYYLNIYLYPLSKNDYNVFQKMLKSMK